MYFFVFFCIEEEEEEGEERKQAKPKTQEELEQEAEELAQLLPDVGGDAGGLYAFSNVVPISKLFGLPVVTSYSVQLIATQGVCTSSTTTLRGIEVRGLILQNVALKGNGYKSCKDTSITRITGTREERKQTLGVYRQKNRVYGCQYAFDGGSTSPTTTQVPMDEKHAWITDGIGAGAAITTTFQTTKLLYAVGIKQNQYHRAKKIKLLFRNNNNKGVTVFKMLTNTNTQLEMIALPGEKGIQATSVTLEILSTYDKYPIPSLEGMFYM